MWRYLDLDELQFMAACYNVSPTANRRNQHREYDSDSGFITDNFGMGDGVIPGDIDKCIFENIPDCGPDYEWYVEYDV